MNNLASFDFGGEVTVSQSRRVFVYNNVLVSAPDRLAAFQFDSRGTRFAFNLIDGPTREVEVSSSNILADPRFVDDSFELSSSSPARNAGRNGRNHFRHDVSGGFGLLVELISERLKYNRKRSASLTMALMVPRVGFGWSGCPFRRFRSHER